MNAFLKAANSGPAGYEDLNDAVRVSDDPTFLLLGSKKNWDRGGRPESRDG